MGLITLRSSSILTRSCKQLFKLSSLRNYHTDPLAKDIETVDLVYDRYDPPKGEAPVGEPIVFLHGLFGSKVNNRTVSKVFARDLKRTVYCLDLRNHGDSPHVERHDYPALAADVEAFITKNEIGPVTLIGHSMGAKTAMAVSLRSPELVTTLIPVDNAPVDTRLSSSFPKYVQAMKHIERSHLKHQKDAYKILAEYEKSVPVQQFLLSNLKRDDNKEFKFRIPVDILGKHLNYMGDFPYRANENRFSKPSLFIRGKYSPYVPDEFLPIIGEFFPRFIMRDVDAGHWLISEKPQEFIYLVKEFLVGDI